MAKATTAETPVKADKQASDKPVKQAKANKPEKPGMFARLGNYFRDVRSEMRRVVWPTRSEVLNSSVVVVTTLLFFIVFITAVDFVVQQLVLFIQRLGG